MWSLLQVIFVLVITPWCYCGGKYHFNKNLSKCEVYVWSALRSLKILQIYLGASIWSTAPLKCQNMFVNGETEWQADSPAANLKLTIFVKAWRTVGKMEEGWGGGVHSTADLLYLPQRSLTWETCGWTETDTRIAQRSCFSARQEESIQLIAALKGRKKGLHGRWQYHHCCFLDTARFDVSLCAETLHLFLALASI